MWPAGWRVSVDGLWLCGVSVFAARAEKERTRPSDVGGGCGGARRRCCPGDGRGDARALRPAMLGEREVEEAVLRDCADIALHGERGSLLAADDEEAPCEEPS